MAKPRINILGICRFSMLGQGDWKAYKNKPSNEELEAIYVQQAKNLFNSERMEMRLQTFEHLTLSSIIAQTDNDFCFLVVSSDRMPTNYRQRLEEICKKSPNVLLKFVPPMHITYVIQSVLQELDWKPVETLQFRLDDDDCIATDCIRTARSYALAFSDYPDFALSFAQQYYCVSEGPTAGVYSWFRPFLGAAVMLRHRTLNVYQSGHYKLQQRFVSITDPLVPNIVTYSGGNDTPWPSESILGKRDMKPVQRSKMQQVYEQHFNYLGPEGLALCRFADYVKPIKQNAATAPPKET